MKAFLRSAVAIFCLILSVSTTGQQPVPAGLQASSGFSDVRDAAPYAQASPNTEFDKDAFVRAVKDAGVATRSFSDAGNLSPGFYFITGVFKEGKNLKRLLRKLGKKGMDPGSFVNPENNLNYVYAQKFTDPDAALRAAGNRLDGKLKEDFWILIVDPVAGDAYIPSASEASTHPASQASRDFREAPGIRNQSTSRGRTAAQSAAQDPKGSGSALLRKADEYFDKMWYTEAADLYEAALERKASDRTRRNMRRVADAHYFNTNMERALYWYEQLYEQGSDQMSADELFRYAHAAKGNGKYARAKRFMRLYDKKIAESPQRMRRQDAAMRETILDNLRSAEEVYGIKNLDINSKYSDFAPMYYEDREIVFASSVDSAFFHTRRYKWNNQPYLDLYVARMNEEGDQLTDAVKFSKAINTKYHEAAVSFSPDHQTMYFTRNNFGKKLRRDKKGVNHLKLYRSRKVNGQWTEAEELPFNGEDYSTGHPALSPDGKQLYFVSDMPGSIGQTDIFVVDVLEDGSFSEPRNLGPEINTEQKEMFPFINDKKLYFSSDGHVGLGGLDVFEVAYNEEDGFLEVRNAGIPINSSKDDFSYIIDETTQKGYFASNRRGGKGDDDIYSFQRLFPEETNENAIAGVVSDLVSGDVIPEAMVKLLDENNIVLKEVVSGDNGSFVFKELEGNTRYRVVVEKGEYFQESADVQTLDNEMVSVEIPMRKLEELISVEDGVRKLKTEAIYFNFDKYNIRSDAAEELDKLVATMQEYPTMVIAIESHTDSRGAKAYNRYLSDRRAKATRDYLIRQGIDPSRIESATGFGEERLLNGCDGSIRCTEAQHQLNRRSEFIIVSM